MHSFRFPLSSLHVCEGSVGQIACHGGYDDHEVPDDHDDDDDDVDDDDDCDDDYFDGNDDG